MKQEDKIIKEVLQLRLQKIDDKSFTNNTVDLHLKSKRGKIVKTSFDFFSLITGLISALFCIVFLLLINSDISIGISCKNSVILLLLSVIYLIFRLLYEIITPSTHC